jgi:hypothetical protein
VIDGDSAGRRAAGRESIRWFRAAEPRSPDAVLNASRALRFGGACVWSSAGGARLEFDAGGGRLGARAGGSNPLVAAALAARETGEALDAAAVASSSTP